MDRWINRRAFVRADSQRGGQAGRPKNIRPWPVWKVSNSDIVIVVRPYRTPFLFVAIHFRN